MSSSAQIARTLIHEMAHAYMAQMIISAGGPGNLKDNLNMNYQTLFATYASHIDQNTGVYSSAVNNQVQHDYMAQYLIGTIAQGIKEYVEANTPAIKNDPYVTMDNYIALAWQTLSSTPEYAEFLMNSGENGNSQQLKINSLISGTSNTCN